MKTVSEFQKNVLFYGLGQKEDKEEVKIISLPFICLHTYMKISSFTFSL